MNSVSHSAPFIGAGDASPRGTEVLLFDGDARVRAGFRKLLGSSGVVVTATDDRDHALVLAKEKFFAVAVVDLDTPEIGAGLQLMSALKERSASTLVVLLAARQTFSVAVEAFRSGASDVIAKSPDNVKYLTEVVVKLCAKGNKDDQRDRLLAKTMVIHEEFLKRLMDASRRATQAEERFSESNEDLDLRECVVLVVDDNASTASGLRRALGESEGYQVVSLQTGGEALDYAGRSRFQLALVKDGLPDLPSSMVARSVRAESEEGIVLLFSHPSGGKPGRADIIETSQSIELIPDLNSGSQLVEQIHELRKAFVAKARERRYLQTFRRDHYDFLRRYAELRQKLGSLLSDGDPALASQRRLSKE